MHFLAVICKIRQLCKGLFIYKFIILLTIDFVNLKTQKKFKLRYGKFWYIKRSLQNLSVLTKYSYYSIICKKIIRENSMQKKIGIISLYHNNENYGGALQAYALCQFLNTSGGGVLCRANFL